MAYDVQIARLELAATFDLKGEPAAVAAWIGDPSIVLPDMPNTSCTTDAVEVLWIGPDHWILRAPLDQETELLARTVPDEISAVHISDTLAVFHLSGPDAEEVMSIASPLDLHPARFPPNGASFTEAFGLKALVCRRPDGFELAVERSFGDMLNDYLKRAIGA